MLFVIDETSWLVGESSSDEYNEIIEQILDCVDAATADGGQCYYSEELFNSPILHEALFYDLYEGRHGVQVSRDLQERIAIVFGRLGRWEDLATDWPLSFDVNIGGRASKWAPSVAWAHSRALSGPMHNVPCIVHRSRHESGNILTYVDGKQAGVWFVSDAGDFEAFYRWFIVNTPDTPTHLEIFAGLSFRKLEFVPGCFGGVKSMVGPYRALVSGLVTHLGALSDHGHVYFGAS